MLEFYYFVIYGIAFVIFSKFIIVRLGKSVQSTYFVISLKHNESLGCR